MGSWTIFEPSAVPANLRNNNATTISLLEGLSWLSKDGVSCEPGTETKPNAGAPAQGTAKEIGCAGQTMHHDNRCNGAEQRKISPDHGQTYILCCSSVSWVDAVEGASRIGIDEASRSHHRTKRVGISSRD
jgi:hypothetical protein